MENIHQIPGNLAEVGENHHVPKAVSANFSIKVGLIFQSKWGYISAQKLESDRSKGLPGSISLQTKASRS